MFYSVSLETAKPTPVRSCQLQANSISNLSTISKILERLALARLRPHLLNSKNFCPLQSAYRAGHSTETAFAKILDDINSGIDQHNVTALVSLDISAAKTWLTIGYY